MNAVRSHVLRIKSPGGGRSRSSKNSAVRFPSNYRFCYSLHGLYSGPSLCLNPHGGPPKQPHAVPGLATLRESQEASEKPIPQGFLGRLHRPGHPARPDGDPGTARLCRVLHRTSQAVLAALASRLREGDPRRQRLRGHPGDPALQPWTGSGVPAGQERGEGRGPQHCGRPRRRRPRTRTLRGPDRSPGGLRRSAHSSADVTQRTHIAQAVGGNSADGAPRLIRRSYSLERNVFEAVSLSRRSENRPTRHLIPKIENGREAAAGTWEKVLFPPANAVASEFEEDSEEENILSRLFAMLIASAFVLSAFVGIVPAAQAAANALNVSDILKAFDAQGIPLSDGTRAHTDLMAMNPNTPVVAILKL